MVNSIRQLEDLLGDPGYSRTIALLTREVMAKWNYSRDAAHSAVLSAIGEPAALAVIHQAWLSASTGGNPGLAAVISRRRVLDLLGKDARRANHRSMPLVADEIETETTPDALRTADSDARAQVELLQLVQLVRGALACFAARGSTQKRQAHLLQRRMLDEIPYRELAVELACTEAALRVRVHAALRALYRHIACCHPELLAMRSQVTGAPSV